MRTSVIRAAIVAAVAVSCAWLHSPAVAASGQEAAQKELEMATSLDPLYADAHFNLAVIYATAQPPAKDLAKRHYTRATSLGAQPDPSLEKLLR